MLTSLPFSSTFFGGSTLEGMPNSSHARPERHEIAVGATSRHYLTIPGANPTGDLLVWLHGSTQSGTVARRFTNHTFDAFAQTGTTVVYPEGIAHHWNDSRRDLGEKTRQLGTDDVAFLRLLIEAFSPNRVIVAGYSNGGQMVIRLLHEAPGLIDAAGIFAATQPVPDNFLSSVTGWKPTPIFLMHGTVDPLSPFHGGHNTRGDITSFSDTVDYYARLNHAVLADVTALPHSLEQTAAIARYTGLAPIEAWALHGVGHVVPCGKEFPERFLGPSTTMFLAAEKFAQFCGLDYPIPQD